MLRHFAQTPITIQLIALLLSILLSGCAGTPPPIYSDTTLTSENAAKIHVYRPAATAWLGQAIDYRVYVNENYVGSMGTKKVVETLAPPGECKVAVHPYFRNDGEEAVSLTQTVNAKEDLYFRFSETIDGVKFGYPVSQLKGHGELRKVEKEHWEDRK